MNALTALILVAGLAAGFWGVRWLLKQWQRGTADVERILRETLADRPERAPLDLNADLGRLRAALRDHTEQGDQQ